MDSVRLEVAVQEGEGWRRHLRVTVPAELVSAERRRVATSLGGRLKIPGFRKGRIPLNVVEKHLGPTLERETLDKVIGEAYKSALAQESLHPISDGQLDEIDFEEGTDLKFRISFDVEPVIELTRTGGFAVERPRAEVAIEQIDQVLERLRDQNAVWTPEEEGTPSTGEMVSVEIQPLDGSGEAASEERRPYEFALGQGEAIPEVEDAILTLSVGESEAFDVGFPEDFPDEERRGEKQRLEITLIGRKTRALPELDDAFARSLGDFDSLDALRERIEEDLTKESEGRAESAVRGRLLDLVIEANPFTVPVSMVDRYIDSVIGDVEDMPEEKLEEVRTSFRPEAELMVKRYLTIDRLAGSHGLRATEEEIDERVTSLAEKSEGTAAQLYANLQKSGRIRDLEREITEQKVFSFLIEQSEVQEA